MVTTIEFLAGQLLKRAFWYLVMASFVGVLMMAWGSWARNIIYLDARAGINKGFFTPRS